MLIDIELQFVEREVVADVTANTYRIARILQSRKLVHISSYQAANGVYDEWTEWADVPLAPQAGAAKGGE